MAFASLRPGVSLVHLLKLYMELIVLNHPVAFTRLDWAAQVFIEKRR
jgi:hypothetical protein